jgi:hypothetical protein
MFTSGQDGRCAPELGGKEFRADGREPEKRPYLKGRQGAHGVRLGITTRFAPSLVPSGKPTSTIQALQWSPVTNAAWWI